MKAYCLNYNLFVKGGGILKICTTVTCSVNFPCILHIVEGLIF